MRVGRGRPDGAALCPLFPVGSRRFPTRCWIRADPWAIMRCPAGPGGRVPLPLRTQELGGQFDRLGVAAGAAYVLRTGRHTGDAAAAGSGRAAVEVTRAGGESARSATAER